MKMGSSRTEKKAARIAEEYGFDRADVARLLRHGVRKKAAIQILTEARKEAERAKVCNELIGDHRKGLIG